MSVGKVLCMQCCLGNCRCGYTEGVSLDGGRICRAQDWEKLFSHFLHRPFIQDQSAKQLYCHCCKAGFTEPHNRVTKTVAKKALHSFHPPRLLSSPWLMSSICADCVSPSCLYCTAQCPCLVSQLLRVIKSPFGDSSVAEWRSFSLLCQDTHQS